MWFMDEKLFIIVTLSGVNGLEHTRTTFLLEFLLPECRSGLVVTTKLASRPLPQCHSAV